MDREELVRRRNEVIERWGAWTSHSIHLGDGVYTFEAPQPDSKLRRFLQVVADSACRPVDQLRVLDLGCLEGAYAVEFALHGAEVVAVEGRKINLAKAEFTKEALELENLDLRLADVRQLRADEVGTFDVVLCLGLLYHLDAPDAVACLQSLSDMCQRVLVIDTHVAQHSRDSYSHGGKTYWGEVTVEHRPGASAEDKEKALWASLDSDQSFTFSLRSLCNALRHVGFTSVYDCLNPYEYHDADWPHGAGEHFVELPDRVTLVAIKGQPAEILSSPVTQASVEIDRPKAPRMPRGTYRQPGRVIGFRERARAAAARLIRRA